jgi:diketogulonate reductase-like aldo/keto reductase
MEDLLMQTVKLNNGIEMPILGFGVYQVPDAAQCEQAVSDALEAGYRLIDTAAAYMNEEAVGAAIRGSGIPREDLFVTTKLWIQDHGYETTKEAFQVSLEKLGLDYLDLYLIHQPFNDYYGSWRAMEEVYEAKETRAIGVCNFYPDRLADLCLNSKTIPAVNQVEVHPLFQQITALETMREFGVQIEAWGPIGSNMAAEILKNEKLAAIGAKYGKSAAQAVLRWHIQRGVAAIPKSVHKERIIENINIFDFSLSDEDMAAIAELDQGHSAFIDHRSAQTAKWLNGFKIHD